MKTPTAGIMSFVLHKMTITAVSILDLLKNQILCRIIWACRYYLIMI